MHCTYIWEIIPLNQPSVLRYCPKCGNSSEYESSDCFRVNANQNLIDVWLIYQCKRCKNTWNMEIISRTNASTIEKELYMKFLKNDKELAKQFAFDLSIHIKNKTVLCYEGVTYEISGQRFSLLEVNTPIEIKLITEFPVELRLDKVISRQLGISREQVKKLVKEGKILTAKTKDICKAKIKNGMIINIHP